MRPVVGLEQGTHGLAAVHDGPVYIKEDQLLFIRKAQQGRTVVAGETVHPGRHGITGFGVPGYGKKGKKYSVSPPLRSAGGQSPALRGRRCRRLTG